MGKGNQPWARVISREQRETQPSTEKKDQASTKKTESAGVGTSMEAVKSGLPSPWRLVPDGDLWVLVTPSRTLSEGRSRLNPH